jgi:biotin carboxyl carrier protein
MAAIPLITAASASASARQQSVSEETVRRQGRAVAALVAKKDAAGLVARFTPHMAASLKRAQLEQVLDQAFAADTPLGERLSETVGEEQGAPVYVADHRWAGSKTITITVALAGPGADRIAGLFFKPGDAPAPPVKPDSASARDAAVLAAGRSVAALVAKKNAAGLHARLTAEAGKALTREKLAQVMNQAITASSPMGERIRDSVEKGPEEGLVTYSAEHRWKAGQNLSLSVTFVSGSGGKIAGIVLRPAAAAAPSGALPPDPKAGYRMKTPLRLPFADGDEWAVVWGGDTREQNYHVDSPDQRHAYDLLVVKNDRTHDGDGKRLEQYYAWGRKIVAPAAGTVITVEAGMPDLPPGRPSEPARPAGNHVLLDIGNSEYVVFAHLQKNSVRVKVGDKVTAGQVLALCGNSGNTSEPHLHFHAQDRPALDGTALGLPVIFTGYTSNGKKVAAGTPVQGELVRMADPDAAYITAGGKK